LLIWPLLAAQRRRKQPPRTAVVTAAIDVTILLIAGLVLCLVLMPVTGARTSLLHLVPGTDIRTAATLIVSMLVEAVQYLIHAGRVTATDDVLLNTLGATVGATASRKWWHWSPRILPTPLPIPAQRRRLIVCENPTLTQTRQSALRPQPWQHPARTRNAS
jgi:hypothetical protein